MNLTSLLSPVLVVTGTVLPGLVLAHHALKPEGRRAGWADSYLFAWAWFGLLFVLYDVAGIGLGHFRWILGVSAIAGGILVVRGALWPAKPGEHLPALLLGVVPPVLGMALGGFQVSYAGDDLAHTAHILEILRSGQVYPGSDFYAVAQATGPDPRFGAAHTALALLLHPFAASGRIVDGWLLACIPFSGILMASWSVFASRFLDRRLWVFGAVALVALTWGGTRFPTTAFAVYPMWIGMGLLILALARSAPGGSRPSVVWAAVAPGALVLIHYFPAMGFLFALGAVGFVAIIERSKSLAIPAGLGIAAVLPALAYRIVRSYDSVNPIHHEHWLAVDLPGDWTMFQPLEAAGTVGLVWLVTLPIALRWLLGPSINGASGKRWLAILHLAPIFVTLFPPLSTPAMHAAGFLIFRILLVAPSALILVVWLAGRSADRPLWHRMQIPVLAVLILLSLVRHIEDWTGRPFPLDAKNAALYREVAAAVPPGEVVLTDPYSSLALSGLTGTRIVALPDGRSSPRDAAAVERLLDAGYALTDASVEETAHLMQKWDARWLWIHPGFTSDRREFLFHIDSGQLDRRAAEFEQAQDWFRVENSAGGRASLFSLREVTDDPHSMPPIATTPTDSPAMVAAPGLSLVDVAFPKETHVAPGTTLRLQLLWERRGDMPPIPWLRAYLRLDHAEKVGGFKPTRMLRAKIAGETVRHTLRFEPPHGYGRSPVGSQTTQELHIQLPANLAPGDYVVRLHVEPGRRSRPIRLGDYFKDEDSFSGTVIGRLQVVPD